uniref:Abhydro_lipase domain-containing protein n=1 Tax=Heterorhabditis bacteriophora TaxID=37862 RepID=A0A1I7XLY1_HETBA
MMVKCMICHIFIVNFCVAQSVLQRKIISLSSSTHGPSSLVEENAVNSVVSPINIDPEAIMTVPEIIQHWGYPVEEHQAITADGYILTIHRIPYGRSAFTSTVYFC